jgi:hypothetical protein
MSDPDVLIALLEGYHITDRGLVRSRDRARKARDAGSTAALAKEMERYFSAVEREASSHLTSLDAKLDELYQRQYNLQAERGVAERRLLGARKVLAELRGRVSEEAR